MYKRQRTYSAAGWADAALNFAVNGSPQNIRIQRTGSNLLMSWSELNSDGSSDVYAAELGTTGWTQLGGTLNTSPTGAVSPDVAITAEGNFFVSIQEVVTGNRGLNVLRWSGTEWISRGTAPRGTYARLAITDGGDLARVVYTLFNGSENAITELLAPNN